MIRKILLSAAMMAVICGAQAQDTASVAPSPLDELVIVRGDTVSMVIHERNYSRYDRGLFNYLFIPKGAWSFGLTASYGEFDSDDVSVLDVVKNFDFKGTMYSIKPTVSYFFSNNSSIGLKFNYTRGNGDLGRLKVDIEDDVNFDIRDVSYYSENVSLGVFYRHYVGLSRSKRFGVFNEVDLSFGSGQSRFKRSYDGELRDTRTNMITGALNFSPGVSVFIVDHAAFNISFGVFGIKYLHEKQKTNGVDEGSRTSSGANFKFNIFNINFGLQIVI